MSKRKGSHLAILMLLGAIALIAGVIAAVAVMDRRAKEEERRKEIEAEAAIFYFKRELLNRWTTEKGIPSTDDELADLVQRSSPLPSDISQSIVDPWGNPYLHQMYFVFDSSMELEGREDQPHSNVSFRVWSTGPDGVNGTPDDIHLDDSSFRMMEEMMKMEF